MPRRSNVRTTRAMSRALRERGEATLRTDNGSHALPSCDPPVAENVMTSSTNNDRAEELDCGGCDRPNNAEPMVLCRDCQIYWHYSCAHVTSTTVCTKPFRCLLCVPPNPLPPPRSVSGRLSTSSARQARVARELERLEEEKRLEEEMQREKHERERLYLARKYEVLNRADEDDGEVSVGSGRSNRSKRLVNWVDEQQAISSAGLGDANRNPSNTSTHPNNHTSHTPLVELPSVDFQSIPVAPQDTCGSKDVRKPSLADQLAAAIDVETTGSITIGESDDEEGAGALAVGGKTSQLSAFPPISPVNIPSVSWALDVPKRTIPANGALPKLVTNKSTYERWQYETEFRRKQQELESQYKKESDTRRKRELELANQLKQLQIQQREELDIQREREAGLKAQLQQWEREQALIEKQKKQEVAAMQDELQRLRAVEQEFLRRQEAQPAPTISRKPPSSSSRQVAAVGNHPPALCTKKPPVSVQNTISNDLNVHSIKTMPSYKYHSFAQSYSPSSASTPVGGRSHYDETESSCSSVFSPHVASDFQTRWSTHDPSVMNVPLPSSRFQPVELGPSSQQLAARHVVSKELPIFAGDPVDWPLFYSSYQHSTQVCGYSDSENLLRLQRSLKGRAREAVSSFLLHPSTVPQVLCTLQTLFGRPEHIVQHMISKVRAIPAPRADRLETLVSFGLAVQNLCGHLEAIGLEQHLSNPMLLQELVDKLPANVKLSWALHQEQVPVVNLSVFGEYMGKIVTATSSVIRFIALPSKDGRSNEKVYVNAHTTSSGEDTEFDENESSKSSDKQALGSKACPACGSGNHQAAGCSSFKRLSLDERWKLVKENELCRRCLTPHARWPCKGEVCGISGCLKRHHRLLHSNYSRVEAPSTQAPTNATVTIHRQSSSSTLFRVLPVTLYGKNGQVNTLAFLDDGSSVTLVEQSLVNKLGVDGPAESLCIQWTGGVKKQIADTNRVQLEISAAGSSKRFKLGEAYTVTDLGLPEQSLNFDEMAARFKHLEPSLCLFRVLTLQYQVC